MDKKQASFVLFTARSSDAEIALVRFGNGDWGITRDGRPLADYRWEESDIDTCIETFMRMGGITGKRTN